MSREELGIHWKVAAFHHRSFGKRYPTATTLTLEFTIFEDSNLLLVKWFIAMYLISPHKKGVSSCQLSRDIKVCQTTAYYMLLKIRKLYGQDDADVLDGQVECDEVYIGGREKWKHQFMRTLNTQGRSTKTKTPVFGMMERSEIENKKGEMEFMSYVRAILVENTKKDTLMPIISQFIGEGSTVFTDELNAYNALGLPRGGRGWIIDLLINNNTISLANS